MRRVVSTKGCSGPQCARVRVRRHALLCRHHQRGAAALPPHDEADVLLGVRLPRGSRALHEALDRAVKPHAHVRLRAVVAQVQGAGHKVASLAPPLKLRLLAQTAQGDRLGPGVEGARHGVHPHVQGVGPGRGARDGQLVLLQPVVAGASQHGGTVSLEVLERLHDRALAQVRRHKVLALAAQRAVAQLVRGVQDLGRAGRGEGRACHRETRVAVRARPGARAARARTANWFSVFSSSWRAACARSWAEEPMHARTSSRAFSSLRPAAHGPKRHRKG